jgi:predicted permease
METFLQDLRNALRQLRRAPGFAVVAVLTLALGLGANIAVLTLIDGILLRPLPYARPAQLAAIEPENSMGVTSMTYAGMARLQASTANRVPMAMYGIDGGEMANLQGAGGRYLARIDPITANLPQVLGVQPTLGRGFRSDENEPGKTRVALLSEALWRKVYLADPQIVGKTVTLHEQAYTVVGVMPRGIFAPLSEGADDESNEMAIWVPAELSDAARTQISGDGPGLAWGNVVARLPEGMTAAQLAGVLSVEQTRIAAEYPQDQMMAKRVTVTGLQESGNHRARRPLLLLYGVALAIWLLACLNVTSLMLARSVARRREQAVRSALGASRARLVRQAITESLLLAALGSAAGLLCGQAALKLLWRALARALPATYAVRFEWRVLLMLVALTLITAFLTGLFPALRMMRRDVRADLQGGLTSTPAGAQNRIRELLVVAQLAITLVLLTGAGLFLRTVHALRQAPLGFSQQNVLTGGIVLHLHNRAGSDPSKAENVVLTRYQPLREKLRALPGVQDVVVSSVLPMRAEFQVSVMGDLDSGGGSDGSQTSQPRADGRVASPGLVEAFGIPMLRGRFFLDSDSPSAPPVVVINQAFADKYLKGRDPIGHIFSMAKQGRFSAMRIVGVIGDVKQGNVTRETTPEIYFALDQMQPGSPLYGVVTAFMQVGIRATVPAQALRAQVEKALASVDPEATTTGVKTIHEAVEDSFGNTTLVGNLLAGFAGLALMIAAIGLYGLLAFLVAQRTRELGIRLALGAPRGNIFSLVLTRAVVLVALGIGLGCVASWFAARVAESYLYGVRAHDAATFACVLTVLTAAGLFAAYLPARRAAGVDPMQALRTE